MSEEKKQKIKDYIDQKQIGKRNGLTLTFSLFPTKAAVELLPIESFPHPCSEISMVLWNVTVLH